MLAKFNQQSFPFRFWRNSIIFGVFLWCVLVLISLNWNIQSIKKDIRTLLLEKTRTHITKDYAFRNWAIQHGGIYVLIDSTTQPNPYLAHVPERDIVTPSGKKLTLMNPAYMMRQIYEQNLLGLVKAHLTSLNPIRPENTPDEWEAKALKKFEQGLKEYYEFTTLNGQPYLRLMQPMKIRVNCLKCHGFQGYKVGDIRGGLSVSLPLSNALVVEKSQINSIICSHFLFWLLGIFVIAVIGVITRRRITEREIAKKQLQESESLYRQLIEVTPQVTFVYDLNGIVLFCSQSAKQLLKAKSLDEIIGHSVFEQIHPDSLPTVKNRLKAIQTQNHVSTAEEKIITFDGKIKYVEASSIRIQFQNQPAILTVVKDITERRNAQQALIESEIKYRETMNAALVGIYIIQDLSFKYVNPQMARYFGYEPEELIGRMSPVDLVIPEQRAFIRKNLQERANGVPGKPYEIKVLRKDGSVFDALVWGKGITYQGKPASVGTLVDITEQKENTRQLNEQLKFAQAMNRIAEKVIAENNPEVILQFITQIAGETLNTDRAYLFSFSFSRQEANIISQWLRPDAPKDNLIPEQFDLKAFPHIIALLPKDKQSMERRHDEINTFLENDPAYKDFLEQYKIKSLFWYPFGFQQDGFDVLVLIQVTYSRQWSTNEREFIAGLTKQVNIGLIKIQLLEQLKLSEQAIKEKEEHYRALFELSPFGILLEDEKGIILDANKSILNSHGYEKKELIGKHVSVLTHPDDKNRVKEHLQKLLNGDVLIHEVKDVHKSGSMRYTKLYEKKIPLPSGKSGILCISHDVTETRLAEQEKDHLQQQLLQAQKMESIGNLAGGIAHDFNNLLTVINGHAELLALKLKDEKLKKDIAAIIQAGGKAANMTRQLLAFSRKEIIQPKILDLNQVIRDMDKMLRRLISEDINIDIQLNENIPRIKADPGQLEQVLMNLIVNARDAIKEKQNHNGRNQITITTDTTFLDIDFLQKYPTCTNGWYVQLIISDNGVGMSEQTKQNIFEPFFTTKEKGKGTGLGLATVYGIVRQNNGMIVVESTEGKGSKFIIYWPVEHQPDLPASLPQEKNKPYTGTESILLVEDEESVRDFAVAALQTNGYRVYQAANGLEALNMVLNNNTKFDLIITDIIMPEMDGKRLARELRKKQANCKILFTTGYTDALEQIDLAENEWKLLRKPYSISQLTRSVREILD